MGDLHVLLNIKLDEDEPQTRKESKSVEHTPVKKHLGLIMLNSIAESKENEGL